MLANAGKTSACRISIFSTSTNRRTYTLIQVLIRLPRGKAQNFNRLIEYLIPSPLTFCQNRKMRFEIKLFEKWIRKVQF